jgi:multicomponent Na+:H+ antiporter subunit E
LSGTEFVGLRGQPTGREPGRFLRAAGHAAVFAALWAALTGGAPETWLVGVPVVAAAAATSLRLWPRRGAWWSPTGLLRFLVLFLRESVRGGVDVARRAFHPDLSLRPGIVHLDTRLPTGPAEVALMNALSLMPGTLGVDLRGRQLTLHVLDADAPVEAETRALEAAIAATFRIPLDEGPTR